MTYCAQCGSAIQPGQRYCPVCGAPQMVATPATAPSTSAPMPAWTPEVPLSQGSVLVGAVIDPERQARWTILLRPLLALPLLIAAFFVELLGLLGAVAAWCAAMVLGRVPDGLQSLLTSVLRLYANVLFYLALVQGRWPGLVFAERPDEPVSLSIDHVRLNRGAVFFRFILFIPANIVSSVLTFGALPLWVVMWVWGVVTGVEPRGLHQAMSLILRYQVRYGAYLMLLTPTQPFKGLFGDTPSSAPAPGTKATSWFISQSAKTLVIVAIVLSVPVYVIYSDADRRLVEVAAGRVIVALSHREVASTMTTFQSSATACGSDDSSCVSSAASSALSQLRSLSSITNHDVFTSGSATPALKAYNAAIGRLETVLTDIEDQSSAATQRSEVHDELAAAVTNFNVRYRQLESRLSW